MRLLKCQKSNTNGKLFLVKFILRCLSFIAAKHQNMLGLSYIPTQVLISFRVVQTVGVWAGFVLILMLSIINCIFIIISHFTFSFIRLIRFLV
jgi:hypothetical protein